MFLWPEGEQTEGRLALYLPGEDASVASMSSHLCFRGRHCVVSLNLNLIWSVLGVGTEKTKACAYTQEGCMCEGVQKLIFVSSWLILPIRWGGGQKVWVWLGIFKKENKHNTAAYLFITDTQKHYLFCSLILKEFSSAPCLNLSKLPEILSQTFLFIACQRASHAWCSTLCALFISTTILME